MAGPVAYGYEPVFSQREMEQRRPDAAAAADEGAGGSGSDSDDDRQAPPNPPDRMASNRWCSCGNCEPLDSPLQCRCAMK